MNILKEIVALRNGKIKDGQQYIDAFTELVFIDRLGNEFKSSPTRLKNGKWSPYETKNPMDKEYHFKVLKEIAQSKGGKIKDGEKYINNSTKMIFVDYREVSFKMTPNNVKNGKWPKKHTL